MDNLKSEIVVVGGSLGGLRALETVLAKLPKDFPLPLVVVLHRDRDSDDTLASLLQQSVALTVVEAEDKQPLLRGYVYLAPPDYHLLIETDTENFGLRNSDFGSSPQSHRDASQSAIRNLKSEIRNHLALSTDAPVNYARPSIDVLFESAADAYGDGVIGILLTGANEDGARGLAAIKARGGLTIAQDPATAEARTMPDAAIAANAVNKVLPLEEIGTFLESEGRRAGGRWWLGG